MNAPASTNRTAAVRIITVLLFLTQSLTVWYLLGSIVFPVTMTVLMSWLIFANKRWAPSKTVRFRLCIGLAAAFIIKSRVAPVHVRSGSVTSMTQFAHVAGQFLMVLQLLLVLTSRRRDLLPQVLPWLGAITMVCAGDLYVSDVQRTVFQMMVLVYVLLAAAFSAMNRQFFGPDRAALRTPALGALMAGVAVLGWWGSSSLHDHSRDLEDLISTLVDPSATAQESGFASQGHLRSVVTFRDRNADNIVLRVRARTTPGYLRGYVFGEYSSRRWRSDQSTRHVLPSLLADVPRQDDEEAFFVASAVDLELGEPVEVWPESDHEALLFLPPEAACVTLTSEAITISREGNVTAPELPSGYPYRVYPAASGLQEELSTARRNEYLVTRNAPDVARELAGVLINPDASFDENIEAVCDYLDQNHNYSDDFEAPPGLDPIEWFLAGKQSGHCEYFATAAALVLRAGGIPARYVTGFVVAEKNDYGDYWIVRNRFAHAWVEAWDDDKERWVLVEATPGTGIPAPKERGRFAQLWNYVKDRYQVLRVRLHQRGFLWAIGALAASYAGRSVIAVLALWLLVILRRKLPARRQRRPAKHDAAARGLHRLLASVDRRLSRRYGLNRNATETLHQFAARIMNELQNADLANWYREYALCRYARPDEAQLERLKLAARGISWTRQD